MALELDSEDRDSDYLQHLVGFEVHGSKTGNGSVEKARFVAVPRNLQLADMKVFDNCSISAVDHCSDSRN